MSEELVNEAFVTALELPADTKVSSLEIGESPQWDSIGHMALMAELESRFGIALEVDDLIEISSYPKALEVLRRHGVAV